MFIDRDTDGQAGIRRAAAMRDCTVSVTSPDGQTHTVELAASSLLDAAAQAMKAWSRLWWWDPDLPLDVTCGDRYWKVGSRWVRASLARRKRGGDGASR